MNEVQALPVAEVDYKWPGDELVVRLSDYDALAAECERLLRMNKGYEATLTRVNNIWKKRWLDKSAWVPEGCTTIPVDKLQHLLTDALTAADLVRNGNRSKALSDRLGAHYLALSKMLDAALSRQEKDHAN